MQKHSMWGKSFVSKTLAMQLIKHWSKSCWSWLNDPRHWWRVALDLELTVRCKQQRPPPAGECRSWRKLNWGVLCTVTVQTAVPKAGRKSEDSFCLLATPLRTHCPKGAEIRKSPEFLEQKCIYVQCHEKRSLLLTPPTLTAMPHWQEPDRCAHWGECL